MESPEYPSEEVGGRPWIPFFGIPMDSGSTCLFFVNVLQKCICIHTRTQTPAHTRIYQMNE